MSALIWIIAALAVVLFIIGVTVQAAGFLLWTAPVLMVAAILLFILNRSGGRRIPR